MTDRQIRDFMSRHRLPSAFRETVIEFYRPLAGTLPRMRGGAELLLLAINGAQGTGKSTLADFLKDAAAAMFGWNAAVLSIDDFYLTLAERKKLAADAHPLLRTRGVPGTHDTAMLERCLDDLARLEPGGRMSLPRFDKAADDRATQSDWPVVEGPLDLVILEGWCVGSTAEPERALAQPINELERDEDADGRWRHYVNEHLQRRYAPLFGRFRVLVFLSAPSFDAVFRWRLEQEQKLADTLPANAAGVMGREQIARFIQHYERLTRHNLATLPEVADVVFEIDETHAISAVRYRSRD